MLKDYDHILAVSLNVIILLILAVFFIATSKYLIRYGPEIPSDLPGANIVLFFFAFIRWIPENIPWYVWAFIIFILIVTAYLLSRLNDSKKQEKEKDTREKRQGESEQREERKPETPRPETGNINRQAESVS